MRLKDKEIEKVACFKIGKFGNEELDENDLSSIEEINISNRKFSGELKNVDLREIALFPNLKSISLQYFTIDDFIIDIINKAPNLQSLQFSSCKFDSERLLKSNSLQSLLLNCCAVKDYSLIYVPPKMNIIGDEHFRLDKIEGKENIEILAFQASKVKGFESIRECNRLRTLTLEGTKVDDKRVLEDIKDIVEVHEAEEYTPLR